MFKLEDKEIKISMKCSCMESNTSYDRLSDDSTELSYFVRDSEDKDSSNEKQEALLFFNDDNSFKTVTVEKNLCVSDLCQLLAVKNRFNKDVNWTIIEHWVDLGLERSLEDHEDVLAVHHDMETFAKRTRKRFVFRKDFNKYEFFINPQNIFPVDMIDWGNIYDMPVCVGKDDMLQNIIQSGEECPTVFSQVWIREENKQVWSQAFLLLKDRKLYFSYKVQILAKFVRSTRSSSTTSSNSSSPCSSLSSSPNNKSNHDTDGDNSVGQVQVFADLSEYQVYTTLNAKNQLRAPTGFGLCLRPTGAQTEHDGSDYLTALKCIACESERARLCWVTAMRLAKYGKQLKENYRSFKNKKLEKMNPKEYNSYSLPAESIRSRVAMDFTGSVGRIVEDPKEAKAIALAEGYSWKRRWRPIVRQPSGTLLQMHGLESGIHITQPWFHSGMTREEAASLVSRHGSVDGVFLVRESRSCPGSNVLTLKFGHKVIHKEIIPTLDPVRNTLCYSIDCGNTKFYDLLQLVEFYQLNNGCLPTRLTHYVVQEQLNNNL